jgi:hypothetical protein
LSKNWLFNLFSYSYVKDIACIELKSHVGLQGFSSVNLDFSICTDGTTFGFVPLQSAIDYGNGLNLPLNKNILAENINTKLSLTPFDVIIGYDEGVNMEHLNYRDKLIYNVTKVPSSNCKGYTYYDADMQFICDRKRSLLCLEIGDEEMYLENWNLDRPARFQCEYDMHVNERNPYYEYKSQTTTLLNYEGIYSKEAPFLITSGGHATFVSDKNNSPTGIGFSYTNPLPTELWDYKNDVFKICFEDYTYKKSMLFKPSKTESEKQLAPEIQEQEEWMNLYPNPNDGTALMIDYNLSTELGVKIEITDLTGKIVFSTKNLRGGNNTMILSLSDLNAGVYIISVSGGEQLFINRLIIQ